ncbi:MAG TPA: hypothetical protein VF831_10165 [Anaerolineales bacterium]
MLSLLLAQAYRSFPSDQVGGSFSVTQYASTEDTGPGFQKARAAGQTSVACTSLHGMALSCHPDPLIVTLSVAKGLSLAHRVTLSAAKGLAGWAPRCFAALSMTVFVSMTKRAVLLPRQRQRSAFRLLSPLLAIPATPHPSSS